MFTFSSGDHGLCSLPEGRGGSVFFLEGQKESYGKRERTGCASLDFGKVEYAASSVKEYIP